MKLSQAELLASEPDELRMTILASLTEQQARDLQWDWEFWARPAQLPPKGDWLIWLCLSGRGWGKTRVSSETIRQWICGDTPLARGRYGRIALVAETAADARDVLVEGESGILACHPPDFRPNYEPSKRRLTWPNGAQATCYNATEPDQLRGPQHDAAVSDELCFIGGTLVAAETGPTPIEAIRAGDRVWTRRGLRRVLKSGMTGQRPIWELLTKNGAILLGTGAHPVLVGKGFKPLASLVNGDMLSAWDQMSFIGADRSGIDTRITTKIASANCSIASGIKTLTARCRPTLMSIIRTLTKGILSWTISKRSHAGSTSSSILRAVSPLGALSSGGSIPRRTFGLSGSLALSFVDAAESNSCQQACERNFAHQLVLKHISESAIPAIGRDFVAEVSATGLSVQVYNLEVEGEPEYFANGVLVHNCKWAYARETWDMLQFGLRLGERPRQIITTTPRPTPVLHEIMRLEGLVVTRGGTLENVANLAPSFLSSIVKRYEGTRLGRQELNAEILDDVPGALWTRAQLDECKISNPPEMQRIVVAIDPSGTRGDKGDMVGIVAAGKGADGRGYILADRSCRMSPAGWGKRAVNLFHELKADLIIAERNFGGAMVEHVIKTADENVPYKEVDASRGKVVRAEPIAALYEQKRISHVGSFPELEDQLVSFTPDGYVGEGSPDNADAAIWSLTELMLGDGEYDWTYSWVGDVTKIGKKAEHEQDDQSKAASLQRFRR